MGHANERRGQSGNRGEAAQKVVEGAAGESALNAKVTPLTSTRIRISPMDLLLQTPFLHGRLRRQRPFGFEYRQGIRVQGRLHREQNVLAADLGGVEMNQDVFADRR